MPSDVWNPAAFRGLAFDGFGDLLHVFARYEDWPDTRDYETHWLRAHAVVTAAGVPLRVIEQVPKSRRAKPRQRNALYDVSVVNGALPTRRRNWHDFFNVMMFAAFSRTKQLLHARHRDILENRLPVELQRIPGARTEEQDCLTILDEGGVVLATAPSAYDSVNELLELGHDGELRGLIVRGLVRPWLFGHAHLEHLAKHHDAYEVPLPSAKPVVICIETDGSRVEVDGALAQCVADPQFCAVRDPRRPIALNNLYLDLPRSR